MGLDAELIAIGPFSASIVSALEYRSELYEGLAEGATVVTTVLAVGTTEASEELARAFGVGPYDFGRHHLDPARADLV